MYKAAIALVYDSNKKTDYIFTYQDTSKIIIINSKKDICTCKQE
jgi:hypothetical protein